MRCAQWDGMHPMEWYSWYDEMLGGMTSLAERQTKKAGCEFCGRELLHSLSKTGVGGGCCSLKKTRCIKTWIRDYFKYLRQILP